jgi:hypothetical protein
MPYVLKTFLSKIRFINIDSHGQGRSTFKIIQASLDLNPGSVEIDIFDKTLFINTYC